MQNLFQNFLRLLMIWTLWALLLPACIMLSGLHQQRWWEENFLLLDCGLEDLLKYLNSPLPASVSPCLFVGGEMDGFCICFWAAQGSVSTPGLRFFFHCIFEDNPSSNQSTNGTEVMLNHYCLCLHSLTASISPFSITLGLVIRNDPECLRTWVLTRGLPSTQGQFG